MLINKQASQECDGAAANGFVYASIGLLLALLGVFFVLTRPSPLSGLVFGLAMLAAAWCLAGLYMLQPNQAALLTLFGSYRGTDRGDGLRWANPFYVKTKVSKNAQVFRERFLRKTV